MCKNCKSSELGIERQSALDAALAECKRAGVNPEIGGFIARHAYKGRTPQFNEQQRTALSHYNTAQEAMKDLHTDYVFALGREAAQARLERIRKPDYLMEYANALERGDLEGCAAIVKLAEADPGLEAAIMLLHRRFDMNNDRSLPEQVLAMRERARGE